MCMHASDLHDINVTHSTSTRATRPRPSHPPPHPTSRTRPCAHRVARAVRARIEPHIRRTKRKMRPVVRETGGYEGPMQGCARRSNPRAAAHLPPPQISPFSKGTHRGVEPHRLQSYWRRGTGQGFAESGQRAYTVCVEARRRLPRDTGARREAVGHIESRL